MIQGKHKERRKCSHKSDSAEAWASQTEQLRALLASWQASWEVERAAVAHEIHDELAQVLVAVKVECACLARDGGPTSEEARERLVQAMALVDRGMRCVRKICTQLRPGVLEDLGLAAAIEWQAGQFASRTGIRCETGPLRSPSLTSERSTAMFRIFQEILGNVAEYAGAHHVEVALRQKPGGIALSVREDGRDIWQSDIASLGLLAIEERAKAFGGRVWVKGAHGQGTTVTVMIPEYGDSMKAVQDNADFIGGRSPSRAARA